MNAPEVVPHVEQAKSCECGSQSSSRSALVKPGEAAHLHPHGEVLPLHIAGGDMGRIGSSRSLRLVSVPRHCAGLYRFLPFGIVAVNLDQLGVVDALTESVRNSHQVHLVAVRGQLNSIRQATGNVLKEFGSAPRIPPSNKPTDSELGMSFDSDEGPRIANRSPFGTSLSGDVLLLAANERPDLIDLNPLRRECCGGGVLVFGAGCANFSQEPKDGALGYARKPGSGADEQPSTRAEMTATLLLNAELVHAFKYTRTFWHVKRKMGARCNYFWGLRLPPSLSWQRACKIWFAALGLSDSIRLFAPILPPLRPMAAIT